MAGDSTSKPARLRLSSHSCRPTIQEPTCPRDLSDETGDQALNLGRWQVVAGNAVRLAEIAADYESGGLLSIRCWLVFGVWFRDLVRLWDPSSSTHGNPVGCQRAVILPAAAAANAIGKCSLLSFNSRVAL